MSNLEGLRITMKAQDIIDLRAIVADLEDEITSGQKNLDHAWAEVDRLKGLLSIALEAESNANARLTDLEDVADKLYQSLQEVLQMQVNGHDLQDRMQFSMPGRAIGGKAYAARKLYEAMKGG